MSIKFLYTIWVYMNRIEKGLTKKEGAKSSTLLDFHSTGATGPNLGIRCALPSTRVSGMTLARTWPPSSNREI